jgi:hypothetical protein
MVQARFPKAGLILCTLYRPAFEQFWLRQVGWLGASVAGTYA